MQTFLCYPDFKRTAKCLDYKRLGTGITPFTYIEAIMKKLKKGK